MEKIKKTSGLTKILKLRYFAFILLAVLLARCGGNEPKFHFDSETGDFNIEELDETLTEEQKQKLDGSVATALFVLGARQHLKETGICPNLFRANLGRNIEWMKKLNGKTVDQIISMTEEAKAEIEKECG